MHRFLTTGSITDRSPKLFLAHCLSTETVLSRWLSATGTLSRSIPCGHRTLLMPNFGSAVLPKPGLAAFLRRLCSLGRTLNPGLLPSYLCFVQLPPWQLFLSPCSLPVTPPGFLSPNKILAQLVRSWHNLLEEPWTRTPICMTCLLPSLSFKSELNFLFWSPGHLIGILILSGS